jgi:integrase/recombinase XerC/integrase/recombinase XerD
MGDRVLMTNYNETQRTTKKISLDFYLSRQVEMFILDRRAAGLSPGTIRFYSQKLNPFIEFCNSQLVDSILQVDANLLRTYMLLLDDQGHNKGGQHAYYRAIRAFLLWYELDQEPDNWKNPIHKIKAPKVPDEILEPIKIETIEALIKTCIVESVFDLRDKALLLLLYDTGLRASEVTALNRSSIDQLGTVYVQHGKGGKDRFVFLGKRSRSAIKNYLKTRTDENPALFLSRYDDRLGYDGLRAILTRRAKLAKVPEPSLHSFRRAFALEMLRAGTDVHTLSKLMGHSSIAVLAKYLKLDKTDVQEAHRKNGPVDHLL